MHTRDIILLQTTATVAAILITYSVFAQSKPTESKTRRPLIPHILVPSASGFNVTKLIACPAIPAIHIQIFAQDARNLQRLVRSLDSADYGSAVANITVFGVYSVVQKLESWRHGGYKFATRSLSQLRIRESMMKNYNPVVIIFDDYMDPSPLHALWFLIQRCAHPNATAIAGGGGKDTDSVAGLAMSAEVWNGFVHYWTTVNDTTTTASVVTYLSLLQNTSVIFPSLPSKDHAFVRSEWQNPAYVEHPPKLMRSWDPEHEPMWGAMEIRL